MAEGVDLARRPATACPPWAWRPRPRRRSRRSGRPRGGAASVAHTSSMSKGSSGIRISVAPPAMPAQVAMWPAWRPMTSTTITRSCDSAVVCRRSMASTQICTAVSKPKVTSVADRSLSIVLGTPTTATPSPCSRLATPSVSSPPMATRASMPCSASVALHLLGPAVDLVGVGARRAEDRAAPRQRAPERRSTSAASVSPSIDAPPAVAEARRARRRRPSRPCGPRPGSPR